MAFIAAIVAFVILFGLQFPHSPKLDSLWLVIQIRKWGNPVVAEPASWFGLAWPAGSISFLPLPIALVTWGVKLTVDGLFLRGTRWLGKLAPVSYAGISGSGLAGLPGFDNVEVSADSEEARENLLKRYREIEKALKAAKRKECTFLSIDVVGSTEMKMGEAATQIAATFQAYEEMLKKIFDQYGAWKQAWTPDGVMICFLDRSLAVGAAQRVLLSLKKFNEAENKLRTPFRVRSGLNEGEVAIYEDSRLEKIADHAIDVAGHMQKHGRPDTLWMPAEVFDRLGDKSGFHITESVVDGHAVYEWTPESL
jgi:class 3 adenylate cyclase